MFTPFEPAEAYLSTYRAVDLIFDPFPYQGLTTTVRNYLQILR